MNPDAPTTLAGGRYALHELIAESPASLVYRASDNQAGGDCAIKLVKPELTNTPGFTDRFARESNAMQQIEHPYLVKIREVVTEGDHAPYIVMDLITGGSLLEYIEKHGPLGPRKAAAIARGLLGALDATHYLGVVHRNVKPANIMVGSDGKPKLANLGLSQLLPHAETGDWPYHPPELRKDAAVADARSDIYAVGATLYTLVTGEQPADLFAAALDDGLLAGMPPTLASVIKGATAYKPDDRYQRAGDMLAELKPIIKDLPQQPIGAEPRPTRGGQSDDATLPHSIPADRRPAPPEDETGALSAAIVPPDDPELDNTGEVEFVEDATDAPSVSQVFAMSRDTVTKLPDEPSHPDNFDDEAPTQTFDREVLDQALASGQDPAAVTPTIAAPQILSPEPPPMDSLMTDELTEPLPSMRDGMNIPAGGADRGFEDEESEEFKVRSGPPMKLILGGLGFLTVAAGAAIVLMPGDEPGLGDEPVEQVARTEAVEPPVQDEPVAEVDPTDLEEADLEVPDLAEPGAEARGSDVDNQTPDQPEAAPAVVAPAPDRGTAEPSPPEVVPDEQPAAVSTEADNPVVVPEAPGESAAESADEQAPPEPNPVVESAPEAAGSQVLEINPRIAPSEVAVGTDEPIAVEEPVVEEPTIEEPAPEGTEEPATEAPIGSADGADEPAEGQPEPEALPDPVPDDPAVEIPEAPEVLPEPVPDGLDGSGTEEEPVVEPTTEVPIPEPPVPEAPAPEVAEEPAEPDEAPAPVEAPPSEEAPPVEAPSVEASPAEAPAVEETPAAAPVDTEPTPAEPAPEPEAPAAPVEAPAEEPAPTEGDNGAG